MDAYIPVSCDFHDQLEALATLRQDCQLIYRSQTGEPVEVHGRIVDVYAANRADFLRLSDGTEIRLDQILSLNGTPVTFCTD